MSQPFSFGFSGDDIETNPNDAFDHEENAIGGAETGPPPIEAKTHVLDELVGKIFS